MRLATLALVAALGLAITLTQAACPHPYSGKAARLKKPAKKKRPPEEPEQVAQGPVLDEECRTNFFDKPNPRRRSSQGIALAQEAENHIREAESKDGQDRIVAVKDALSKLRNALKADPYGAEATYKMAVAYALVGKKGCAVALLQRLSDLTKMPEVESEANRIIDRASRDQRFDLFRKEADAALGR